MKMAKLFLNGRSQAVRLPKEFQFPGNEVCIARLDNVVILFPKGDEWQVMGKGIRSFTDDFMAERNQPTKLDRRVKL
jgi:antitoxin VapB